MDNNNRQDTHSTDHLLTKQYDEVARFCWMKPAENAVVQIHVAAPVVVVAWGLPALELTCHTWHVVLMRIVPRSQEDRCGSLKKCPQNRRHSLQIIDILILLNLKDNSTSANRSVRVKHHQICRACDLHTTCRPLATTHFSGRDQSASRFPYSWHRINRAA